MRLKVATAAVLSTLLAAPAWGQDAPPQRPCGPIDQIAAKLGAEYQETRVQQGVAQDGAMLLVIFAAPDGATWTAVMVRPDGVGCMAAAGTDWQARSDPAPAVEEGL
jgi:hypothetical protein